MADANEIVPVCDNDLLSEEERLTLHFSEWEKRGRGWNIYPYPVEIEPPFRPFLFHFAPTGPIYDDARKPTFFSSLVDKIFGQNEPKSVVLAIPEEIEPDPEPAVFTKTPI